MSKQSKKKARKRRERRNKLTWEFVCPKCQAVDDGSEHAVMTNVADALNVCADSGIPVKAWHGILKSEAGYILPLDHGHWTARTTTYDRFPPPAAVPDDGFDD